MSNEDWSSGNRRLLSAEFSRLKAQIEGNDLMPALHLMAQAREALQDTPAIDLLAEAFELSTFERDVLLLCAGVEMDRELAATCASHNGKVGGCFATWGLALASLAAPHWSAVAPLRPLRLWRLVELQAEHEITSSRLCIDERVLHFLAGVNYLDPRLRSIIRECASASPLADSHVEIVATAVHSLRERGDATVIQLIGDDSASQMEIARRIAQQLDLGLHVMRAADIPGQPAEADAFAMLWYRESVLSGSALLIKHCGEDMTALPPLVERLGGITILAAVQPAELERACIRLQVDKPLAEEQRRLWTTALGDAAQGLNGKLDAIASQFRLDTGNILRLAQSLPAKSDDPEAIGTMLWSACRESAREHLDGLAQRVEARATWEDLVLPAAQISTLREVAMHVRQRLKVYDDWGFRSKGSRGLGISVLFSGESGTGKTMAAEVLANDLNLDLYRIDLAAMVSKYIGETEKNLRRVFDAAENSGAILLFDEADALFGKRSETKDSHDRYANIEVSYLLQRMEAYRGLAILTTNLKGALDVAFQRRLRFIVQFPFPDVSMRERIWRGAFPARAPLHDLDYMKLAKLNVPGGTIRNIALNAAFTAAEDQSSVSMSHLLAAARAEASKRERAFSDAEVRGWA